MSLEKKYNSADLSPAAIELSYVFEEPTVRPEPDYIESLIMDGLTENDIDKVWDGQETEVAMETTLNETEALLPNVHEINDTLAQEDKGSIYVFAGRDAETLYDDFVIAYPEKPSVLLPASMKLWNSREMRKPSLVRDFLSTYELSQDVVTDSSVDFVFIDSGFHGNAGVAFRRALHTAYGIEDDNRTSINLVSASSNGFGKTITNFTHFENIYETFARAQQVSHLDYHLDHMTPENIVAIALQLQPRYHGAFKKLERQSDGTVRAVPSTEGLAVDVDAPRKATIQIGRKALFQYNIVGTNVSVVHPLAAAKAQYRVIEAALERSF